MHDHARDHIGGIPRAEFGDIRTVLDTVLADRRAPEARALFLTLSAYVEKRAGQRVRARYADILGASEVEEAVGEVMVELLSGALAQFRGDTLASLLAFVRCITDRTVWRVAQRRLRERTLIHGAAAEAVTSWGAPAEVEPVELASAADCPMAPADMEYLRAILEAGGRARYAETAGVSRAAVTQRVQRIKARLEQMSAEELERAEAWMHGEAARTAALR